MTPGEQISAQYLQWELRGRGWFVHPEPVALEPPFQPFRGYRLAQDGDPDDARRPSMTERLLKKAGQWLDTTRDVQTEPEDTGSEREVAGWSRRSCHELALTFPKSPRCRREQMEAFLRLCRACREPVSFEVLADHREIGFQWACGPDDVSQIKACSATLFTDCAMRDGGGLLSQAWQASGAHYAVEPDYRNAVLDQVNDADVVYYWRKGFPQLGGSKSIGPVLTRLQTFLSPKPIRHMVGQKTGRLDIQAIMDSGKILLAKLPRGLMGAENSYLLGSLLVARIQQAAMSRQRMPEGERRPFTLYVDEFQNFVTPSMAEILSGGRKYRLSLVLAHQELAQISRNDAVGSAVLANAGTRVVFRVGDSDARELAKGFTHFEPEALQSQGIGEAVVRVERSDQDFNLTVPFEPSTHAGGEERRLEVIARSRAQYAISRSDIEAQASQRLAESPSRRRPAEAQTETVPAKMPAPSPAPPKAVMQDTPVVLPPAPTAEPNYESSSLKADLEELGRGGDIHKTAQAEFKRLAEQRGFRATIERQLPGSLDTVDLYLERDGLSIACEISVTNTLDYEMRNVTKCLRAGVQRVLLLTVDPVKHQRLGAALAAQLPPDQQSRVLCLQQPDFVSFLDSIPAPVLEAAPGPGSDEKPKVVKGWKVRTRAAIAPNEELTKVEKELAATLAENLRRRKTVKRPEK